MILEQRNKQPFLHFGFNRQKVEAYVNTEVEFFNDTLTENTLSFTSDLLIIEDKINLNNQRFKAFSNVAGTFTIQANESNIIEVIYKDITM